MHLMEDEINGVRNGKQVSLLTLEVVVSGSEGGNR